MEHKFKLRELVHARLALQELGETKLKASAAFTVSRLLQVVGIEQKTFDESHSKILKKFAVAHENGGMKIPPEKEAEAQAEFEELLDTGLTLTFDPVPIELLGEVEVKPAVLLALDRFLKE